MTVGCRGILLSLSLEVPINPLKKDATSSLNSSGSSRSEPSAVAASSVPPLSFLPTTSLAVPALRPCPHFWIGLGAAQSYDFFLQGSHHGQHFLVGLMYSGQTPLHQTVPTSLLEGSTSQGLGVCQPGSCCGCRCPLLPPPLVVFERGCHLFQ